MKPCSVLILAAGSSSRIDQQKFTLKFDEKTTFLEKIIEQYKNFGVSKIVCVLNPDGIKLIEENYANLNGEIIIVNNDKPHLGRSYSITLGLKEIPGSHMVFVQNIDNPFVTPTLLKTLFEVTGNFDFVSPQYRGQGGHPILLSQNIVRTILALEGKVFILKELLNYFKKKIAIVDDPNILVNINTRTDYNKQFMSGQKL